PRRPSGRRQLLLRAPAARRAHGQREARTTRRRQAPAAPARQTDPLAHRRVAPLSAPLVHLEPFHNYVVLRLLAEPRTHGLVEAVALEERPSAHATVVAIGPDCRDVQRGDRVLVSRLQGF